MWRETGAGTVTNKSPSMTAFCWSISFSHNIMVCYCPLSVLSVPESILNEGQLHLAAIFQLSPRCHGNSVVSRWTCRWRGVGGWREGEPVLQEVGVSGCGVRRRPAPRAKGQGRKKKKKKKRTAQNRFVTLCLHLINRPFYKHYPCSSGRFSSAEALSPDSPGAHQMWVLPESSSFPSLTRHASPYLLLPQPTLGEWHWMDLWLSDVQEKKSLISTKYIDIWCLNNPCALFYNVFFFFLRIIKCLV